MRPLTFWPRFIGPAHTASSNKEYIRFTWLHMAISQSAATHTVRSFSESCLLRVVAPYSCTAVAQSIVETSVGDLVFHMLQRRCHSQTCSHTAPLERVIQPRPNPMILHALQAASKIKIETGFVADIPLVKRSYACSLRNAPTAPLHAAMHSS